MKQTKQVDDVSLALQRADRSPGWNNRSRDVMRFELGDCVLYVVPFRRWAYRRDEMRAEAWRSGHQGASA